MQLDKAELIAQQSKFQAEVAIKEKLTILAKYEEL
jgi:hypothetical protein